MIHNFFDRILKNESHQNDADRFLTRKKRLIYLLLVLSTVITLGLVLSFGWYFLSLRELEGQIFLYLAKQRSQSQLIINSVLTVNTAENAENSLNALKKQSASWVSTYKDFNELIRIDMYGDLVYYRADSLLVQNTKKVERIDSLIQAGNLDLEKHRNMKLIKEEFDQFITSLNQLSEIILSASDRRLGLFVRNTTILLVISLSAFVYLFIFQIRPLFNQLFYKNQELRNISSQQSHIIRAPLANILGLVYLLENADSMEEGQEYVRLIRLNAEAIDHRIHKLVDYAEKLQDFDGNPEKLMEWIVLDEREVSSFN